MISVVYGRILKSDLSGCDSSDWKCSVDNCVLAILFTFSSFFLLPLSSPHPTFLSPPFPSLQQGYVSSVLQSSSGERPSSGVSSMSSSLSSRGQSPHVIILCLEDFTCSILLAHITYEQVKYSRQTRFI